MAQTQQLASRPHRRAGVLPPGASLLRGLPERVAVIEDPCDDPLRERDRTLSATASDYVLICSTGVEMAEVPVSGAVALLDARPEVGLIYDTRAIGSWRAADTFAEAMRTQGATLAWVLVRRSLLQTVMYAGRERERVGDADLLREAGGLTRCLRWGAEECDAQPRRPRRRILRIAADLTRQGAQRTVRNLCLTVDPDEWETEVLALRGGAFAEELEAAGVRVIIAGSVAQFKALLPARANRADVVHLHYWGHHWDCLEPLERSNKLVVTSHCDGIRYTRTAAWSVVPYHIAPDADADRYAPQAVEIVSGMDFAAIDEARCSRGLARRRNDLPLNALVFVNVTKAERIKGWRAYLDAAEIIAREHPRAVFYAIGPAEWHREWDDYCARVAELQAAGVDVRTEADVPLSRVVEIMCAADVMVSTSDSEATPLALREAAYCRVPIVATNVGGTSQVVPENAVLLDGSDPEKCAAAMLAQVGKRGGDLPWARWALDAQARRYEELYRLVCDGTVPKAQVKPLPSGVIPAELRKQPTTGQRTFCAVVKSGMPSGGTKAIQRLCYWLRWHGWFVEVALANADNAEAWADFSVVPWSLTRPHYTVVMGTFVATRPKAREIDCDLRIGFVQSDEPKWAEGHPWYQEWRDCFELDGFREIIIADHMREFAAKYGMNIVGQITPGVDSHVFCPKQDFANAPRPANRVLVVTKGARVWYDGHDYLVPALNQLARRHPQMVVDWLGIPPPPELEANVEHHQSFDEDEVSQLYSRATVYVLASIIEGSPLTVREAMACGTAVVTTPTGIDYGRHGENLLLVPHRDTQAIVEAIDFLLTNPRERERIALNGLREARENMSWEKYCADFEAIIERELA